MLLPFVQILPFLLPSNLFTTAGIDSPIMTATIIFISYIIPLSIPITLSRIWYLYGKDKPVTKMLYITALSPVLLLTIFVTTAKVMIYFKII